MGSRQYSLAIRGGREDPSNGYRILYVDPWAHREQARRAYRVSILNLNEDGPRVF